MKSDILSKLNAQINSSVCTDETKRKLNNTGIS